MNSKKPPDAAETLRMAVQKLKHISGPACSEPAVADVTRTLVKRLADCEAELAIIDHVASLLAEPGNCCPACLPPLTLAEMQVLEDAIENRPRHKLD